ncbi:MAG: GNAT family N-acetyltransferase [Burkholderiales bacterium]|nr:GNAT family N-acetyltransferase [Anaerolineae bacterium]
MPDTLVTSYLEMNSRAEFRPSYRSDPNVFIMLMEIVDLDFYRFLYGSVGKMWRWCDRLIMPEHELEAALNNPNVEVYVMYVSGVPAGYVELCVQEEGTEVAYFGLRPEFIGRGLSSHLLSWGIAQAWANGARRVFVHTCNLDHPNAMETYIKRGFRTYKTVEQPMPDRYL